MKDENNRAKLLTIGIAALLIVMICGISFVVTALNKNEKEDNSSRLQSEILEYANSTQESEKQQEGQKTPDEAEADREEIAAGEKEDADGSADLAADTDPSSDRTAETGADTQTQSVPVQEAVVVEQMPEEQPAQTAQAAAVTGEDSLPDWQRDVSENLAQVEIDLQRQMSEMKGYWEAGNMEAVEDLAYLPRYRAASEKLKGTTKYYYYGDTDEKNRPHGKGLASYADNQYYYGEWSGGVRSGSGMWIKYYVYGKDAKPQESLYLQHSYSGSWAGDLPDGEGAEHYDLIMENLKMDASYNSNFIGTFKKGLYHGEMYITNVYGDGNTKEWSGTAREGVWKSLGEKDQKGQYPVIFEISDPDNYQWMPAKDNKKQGVTGLITSAVKKGQL